MIASLRGVPPRSPFGQAIAEIVDAWAVASDTVYGNGRAHAVHLEGGKTHPELPRWVKFLLAFDVDYRKRRLHFLIEGQNRLYQMFDQPQFAGYDRTVVDRLKRSFYECLDALNRCESTDIFTATTFDLARRLFMSGPSPKDAEDLKRYARDFVGRHRETLDLLMERMAVEINLDATTNDVDVLLASTDLKLWHPEARRDVLVNYLGFPFWDVLTFPVMTWRDVGEFNKILIDRISPQDAKTLAEFCGTGSLKGTGFVHFAAFFSRAYRENDYLLGRLHALDRLFDIVCNSAEIDLDRQGDAILALKKNGFLRILEAEEKHLPMSAGLIAALRRCVSALGAAEQRCVKT
jgi:hypothetical protein